MKSKLLFLLALTMAFSTATTFGQQWTAIGGTAFSPANINYTSMALGKNDTALIAFRDDTHNDAISVMKFNGSAWTFVGSPGFSNTVYMNAGEPVLVLKTDTSGTPYVFYQDSTANGLSVMKYNGSSWVYLDSPGIAIAQNQPEGLSMDIAPDGTPYIALIDGNHTYAASVYKYSAALGWVAVGPINFTPGSADWLSLKIDYAGTPWIAFSDGTVSSNITVQKFNGSNWTLQGPEGFATPSGQYALSMAFNSANQPYVVYGDNNNSFMACVRTLIGGNWVAVGDTDFSASDAYYTNIFITNGNVPVVTYSDHANANKATAMYFNGISWVNLGSPDFSQGEADWLSLAVSRRGVPYVGFSDAANSHAATVYSFGVPAGISTVSSLSRLEVYPNPGNGWFQVSMEAKEEQEVQLSVCNMMGQLVWQGEPVQVNGVYHTQIDLSNNTRGVYVLSVRTAQGIESHKLELR